MERKVLYVECIYVIYFDKQRKSSCDPVIHRTHFVAGFMCSVYNMGDEETPADLFTVCHFFLEKVYFLSTNFLTFHRFRSETPQIAKCTLWAEKMAHCES